MPFIDEANLNEDRSLLYHLQAERLKKRFEKRRINFHACDDRAGALDAIERLILGFVERDGIKLVSFGDSVTLHQLGVFSLVDRLAGRCAFKVLNPFARYADGKLKIYGEQPEGRLNLPREEYFEKQRQWIDLLRQTMLSDVLIIGANAITQKGDIVSTDGTGNRVAGMIFGPRRVIVAVGRNKLVRNIEEAICRNRNVAAPLNFIRHNLKHHGRYDSPCVTTGFCIDCEHPHRSCLNTVIVSGATPVNADRIHLLYVNDDLGL